MATEIEFNTFLEDPKDVLRCMPVTFTSEVNNGNLVLLDKDVFIDAELASRKMSNVILDNTQFQIMAVIFKRVIYPESLDYIKIDVMVNLLAISATYLYALGFKSLALFMLSYRDKTNSDKFFINLSSNRSRVPKELKDELSLYFPFEKDINSDTKINVVEDKLNILGNDITSKRWLTFMPRKYLDELQVSNGEFISPDIKIQLTQFMIKHEQILIANKDKEI